MENLMRALDWSRHKTLKHWVTLKQAASPLPLQTFPWLSKLSKHPIIGATWKVCQTLQLPLHSTFALASTSYSGLSWLSPRHTRQMVPSSQTGQDMENKTLYVLHCLAVFYSTGNIGEAGSSRYPTDNMTFPLSTVLAWLKSSCNLTPFEQKS